MKLFLCLYFDQYCSLARYISIYIEKYFCKSISYKIVKKLSKKIVIKLSNFCQTSYILSQYIIYLIENGFE